MMIRRALFLLPLCLVSIVNGQTSAPNVSLPRIIRYTGTSTATSAVVGITFALYRDENGGSPLWLETQNVKVDAAGHFSVLLGSAQPDGLPADLFSANEVRWLGIKQDGQDEQPRVPLASVPYALKAGDAETLGGFPISAFVMALPAAEQASSSNANAKALGTKSLQISTGTASPTSIQPDSAGTQTATNFTDSTTDQVVLVTQNGPSTSIVNRNYGLWAIANGDTGVGLRGEGRSKNASTIGVWGVSYGPTGTGLLGEAVSGTGANWGLRGKTQSTTGTGLAGWALATSGNTIGINATVSSPSGTGVLVSGVGGNLLTLQTNTSNEFVVSGTGAVTASGTVQSTTGGFKFPDGSVLASANNNSNVTSSVNYSGSTSTQIIDAVQNQAGGTTGFNASGVPAGVRGDSTTTSGYAAGVFGSAASIYAPGVAGVNTSQCDPSDLPPAAPICKSYGVFGWSVLATRGTGVWGQADNTSEDNVGVYGQASGQFGTGVFGYAANNSAGDGTGVYGLTVAPNGAGVWGYSKAASGSTVGVYGAVVATTGYAGQFDAPTGGNILLGRSGTSSFTNVFRVDANGKGYFNGGTQTSGADFAESVDAIGGVSQYQPGDVMMIDSTGTRRLALANGVYSTKVAGIYSTKPGVLATPHEIDDSSVNNEVPLAIIGIVPCKVSAENGPIHAGDLLVTASRPGYAMKGTDRRRMMGAVVGKALGSLDKGTGTIEVLVSLH